MLGKTQADRQTFQVLKTWKVYLATFLLDPKLQLCETRALKDKETVGYASRTFIELEKWYAMRTLLG
ncbi:MAG: hypothetical protein ACXV7E_07410 [Methylobacter sp.]